MTPTTRARLDRHLTADLCPRARVRARELRNALYAVLSLRELRAEYMRVLEARTAASGARNVVLGVLGDDLAEWIEAAPARVGPGDDARAVAMAPMTFGEG